MQSGCLKNLINRRLNRCDLKRPRGGQGEHCEIGSQGNGRMEEEGCGLLSPPTRRAMKMM